MQISITATLSPEQIFVLSTQKGYSETIISLVDGEHKENPNPQSREDFIRQVYEGMIIGDATRIFIDFSNKQKEADRIAEENSIRDSVTNSITSSIENV